MVFTNAFMNHSMLLFCYKSGWHGGLPQKTFTIFFVVLLIPFPFLMVRMMVLSPREQKILLFSFRQTFEISYIRQCELWILYYLISLESEAENQPRKMCRLQRSKIWNYRFPVCTKLLLFSDLCIICKLNLLSNPSCEL